MSSKNVLFLLNCILIIYYLITVSFLGWPSEEVMYSSTDARSYREVGNWIFGFVKTDYTLIRPVLYPVITKYCLGIAGIYGLWVFQALCWLGTINLTFLSLKLLSTRTWVPIGGSLVVALNFSFIALTLHGLSEVTTTFTLSLFTYFLIRNWSAYRELWFFHGCLGALVTLSLLRPVFFPALIILLIAAIPLGYLKQYLRYKKQLIILVAILIPLLFQMAIMKTRHDTFSISRIGSLTVRNYFFARVYGEQNNIEYTEAVALVKRMSASEQYDFAMDNKQAYLNRYFEFLYENIDGKPVFVLKPWIDPVFGAFMKVYNKVSFLLHLAFLIPIVIFLYTNLHQRNRELILFGGLAIPFYLVIFTSGLSFWQGDRLVLPTIGIWVVLYVLVVKKYRESIRSSIADRQKL